MSNIQITPTPAGLEGQGFFATKVEEAIGLARANSIWPLPFATSCCGIEFMATMTSNYDLARFGSDSFISLLVWSIVGLVVCWFVS